MLQFDNWAEDEPNGIIDGNIVEDVVEMLSHRHGGGHAGKDGNKSILLSLRNVD